MALTYKVLGTASTASFVTLAQTASYVTTAQTASYVTTAQTASFVTLAQTASLSLSTSGSIIVSELVPISPSTGSMYFDATTPSIVIWNGTNWYSASLSLL